MKKRCLFCNRIISQKEKKLYCSDSCIKKMWYVKNLKENNKSIYKNYKDFLTTQTGIGYNWEIYVANKLGGKHLPFNKAGVDVVWNNKNIDVKVCEEYRRKIYSNGKLSNNKSVGNWVFNKNKPKINIDYYFCICLKDNKPIKHLLIPREHFKGQGITIGYKSIYDKFIYDF